ncbi:hypothetical protein JXB41_06240 [Candidatus Woesearchaeota archaeon]|nr:hypothetical protein [Candidatus Woesearchaeota archaeon]
MAIIKVKHIFKNNSIEGSSDSGMFILTNKKGGYFLSGYNSKFRGLFFAEKKDNDFTLFKTIDSISVNKTPVQINNMFFYYEQLYRDASLSYLMHNNSLLIEVQGGCELLLTLDMREIYDFSSAGRIYEIKKQDNLIIITYKKYSDDSLKEKLSEKVLVIKSKAEIELVRAWREQFYEHDSLRSSQLNSLWVFDALKLKVKNRDNVVITYSGNKDNAAEESGSVHKNFDLIFNNEKHYLQTHFRLFHNKNKKVNIPCMCASKALDNLIVAVNNMKGIYAGLPWFFQFWTRDEAISLGALIKEKKYHVVKKILMRLINSMQENGRIPNRYPHAELASADGAGWVFKRTYDLFEELDRKELSDYYFKKHEKELIKEKLEFSINKHLEYFFEDNLIKNNAKETWMDTSFGDDTRAGFRIEIQALFLCMLKLLNYLSQDLDNKNEKYISLEQDIKQKAREVFFDSPILKDGKDDATIRPNIFIAYYVYPELLDKGEWLRAFESSLKNLWLNWGGLASIDKENPLFCKEYSGENNKSYHRGDSWFWINNLAAICMNRLDKIKFRKYTNQITKASSEDILFKGLIAQHAELSSASSQKAEGCLAQAWSAAMFVELINEIY